MVPAAIERENEFPVTLIDVDRLINLRMPLRAFLSD